MSTFAGSAHKLQYDFLETLGAGSFGTVRRAIVRRTGEEVAIKIILKSKLQGHLEVVKREIQLLASMSHPHIVKLIDFFETKHNFYIVTQLATGGELFERLVEKTCLTEYDVCGIIYQMLTAITYLHDKGIVHRDIKPENVLYLTRAEDSPVVLADFGVSKQTNPGGSQKITGLAGSYGYIAPEVYASEGYGDLYGLGRGGYTKACDIWSLGVVAYTLIGGYSPFRAETPEDFLDEVRSNNFVVFHQKYWSQISEDAKDYIVKSLDIDNRRRPSAHELLRHPWIVKHLAQKESPPDQRNIIGNIREGFNADAKWRKAVRLLIIQNNLGQLRDLRRSGNMSAQSEDFAFHATPVDEKIIHDFGSMSLEELRARQRKSNRLTSTFQNLVRVAQESKDQIRQFQEDEDKRA